MDQVFCFCEASLNDVFKEMKRLEAKKPMQIIDILAKILKENADISSVYICDFLNETMRSRIFPAIFKK